MQAQLGLRETTDTRQRPVRARRCSRSSRTCAIHARLRRLLVLGRADARGAAAGPARRQRAIRPDWDGAGAHEPGPGSRSSPGRRRAPTPPPSCGRWRRSRPAWLAAWRARSRPVRRAPRRRADRRPRRRARRISLVLPPAGVRLPFDDLAVQQARRGLLAAPPLDAVTTLLRDDSHFEGSLSVAARPARRPPRRRPVRARLPPRACCTSTPAYSAACRRRPGRPSSATAAHSRGASGPVRDRCRRRRAGRTDAIAHDPLTPKQEELCATSPWDFSDLRAVFINCTLKRSPEPSNTQGLADRSIAIMRAQRRRRRVIPRDRPRHRHRRLAGHDRARLGARRLARDLREGDRRRHPRAAARRSGWARSPRSARR